LKKEACGGNPRDEDLDQWQRERQSSVAEPAGEPVALVFPPGLARSLYGWDA
jgi:hypothetical protein